MSKTATSKSLGLVLGSGAARGWAHLGVLQGLKEIGVKPDIIAGCSVGALVGAAHITGAIDELSAWARELGPLSAFSSFALSVKSGGLVDTGPAFEAFKEFDADITSFDTKFGAVAADLATGEEVWITEGSIIRAARASSAIPVVFHSIEHQGRWLVDGALANPTPVSLARELGADVVVAVDLNAVPKVLERFQPAETKLPAVIESPPAPQPGISGAVVSFLEETRRRVEEQLALAKSRQNAKPQLFETAYAAADIFQMHLSRARLTMEKADIWLQPDMRDALPNAFDRADEFIAEGRRALLEKGDEIKAALAE